MLTVTKNMEKVEETKAQYFSPSSNTRNIMWSIMQLLAIYNHKVNVNTYDIADTWICAEEES